MLSQPTLAALALLAATTAPTLAQAKTLELPWNRGETIRFVGSDADIQLRTWDRDEVRVESDLDRAHDEVALVVTPEGLSLKLRPLARGGSVGGALTLYVPRGAPVEIETGYGAVDVEGRFAGLSITSMAGAVKLGTVHGRQVSIHSFEAPVSIEAIAADQLSVRTWSGSIDIHRSQVKPGGLDVASYSARVSVVDAPPVIAAN